MNNNKKTGIQWSTIVIGLIIYALFMLWTSQRNENEKAKQIFAEQTARAENQLTATKQIEDKVKNCARIDKSGNTGFVFNSCVFGYIYDAKQVNTSDNEPNNYLTYFSSVPNTFYLFGGYNTLGYVGDCVKVWGEIKIDTNGIRRIYLDESGENIERLPDEICS